MKVIKMKKFLLLFSLLFMISIPSVSFADEPAKNNTVSVDDVKQLAEQVQALRSIVNGNQANQTPVEKTKEAESSKTMATVADRALTMLGSAVGTVSETLKKMGPEVWRIMIRQQYANAAEQIIGPLFALIASIVIFFSLKKIIAIKDDDSHRSGIREFKCVMKFVTCIVPCICALIVAIQLSSAIAMIVNPEYYALKDLLGLMTGR